MDRLSRLLYKTFLPIGGKTIAILGGRAVGKSSLKEFLERGKLPSSYKVTDIAEQYAPFRASDLGIRIKASQDVGGGDDPEPMKAYYDAWETAAKSSDYVFYLINIQRFLLTEETDGNIIHYKERVRNDIINILEWLKNDKPIVIIGTYADQYPEFSIENTTDASNQIQEIQTKLLKDNTIDDFCQQTKFGKDYVILIGSLGSNNFAKKLVVDLREKLRLAGKISKNNNDIKKKEEKEKRQQEKEKQ